MNVATDAFIRDAWYIVALSDEVSEGAMLARRILDEPVLLFRDAEGAPRAVADVCPHRFAPLSRGKITNGIVACGYHGLEFDGAGRCVRNPHGTGRVPNGAQLRSYAVREIVGLIWMWAGHDAPPESSEPPVPDFLASADQADVSAGHRVTNAHYMLMIDNIMDLSHSDFLHANVLGTGEIVTKLTPTVTTTEDGRVMSSWEWSSGQAMGVFAPLLADNGRDARGWLRVDWQAPAHMCLWTGAQSNTHPNDEPLWIRFLHSMTPCDKSSTHYFFVGTRSFNRGNREYTEASNAALHHIFGTEDAPMIEAAQRNMGDREFWSMKPWFLECDTGAVRVRRMIERRLCDEVGEPLESQSEISI